MLQIPSVLTSQMTLVMIIQLGSSIVIASRFLKMIKSSIKNNYQPSLPNSDVIAEALSPEKSFWSNEFIPTTPYLNIDFLAKDCHWQTIFGSHALPNKIFGVPARSFQTQLERIETPDGDFFDVEYTEGFNQSDAIVLLSHGLESNARGQLMGDFAQAFLSKGFSVCLINFRGCSGEMNRCYFLESPSSAT